MEKKLEYSTNEITIIWKPDLCMHSGICVRMLPAVYHPKEKPWINAMNADTEALVNQINCCPSGALSYRLNPLFESDKII
ncbi:MAG: (4Fe-4S)-binding protein [Saprospiraceae bacterium]|nr:(4Fe-4S)-binding protein [Saprospiraceae bacterium]